MSFDRRDFFRAALAAGGAGTATLLAAEPEPAKEETAEPNHVGCLVDTTLCIGCRQCESACNTRNKLPKSTINFADRTIFRSERRPSETAFTVVNEFPGSPSPDQGNVKETFVKVQCMHCLTPSCVSACIVGALTKASDGSIVYNPDICLGCRYCQVSCPFEIPAYEFDEPLTPRVRKCEFCTDRQKGIGANPACAASCPTEALVFGKRAELIHLARDRMAKRPDRYTETIYGEKEVGGTSWLYLTGRPYTEVGLLKLQETAPALRTEAIQHGIFKYGFFPIAFYGLLSGIMWFNNRKENPDSGHGPSDSHTSQASAQDGKGGRS